MQHNIVNDKLNEMTDTTQIIIFDFNINGFSQYKQYLY